MNNDFSRSAQHFPRYSMPDASGVEVLESAPCGPNCTSPANPSPVNPAQPQPPVNPYPVTPVQPQPAPTQEGRCIIIPGYDPDAYPDAALRWGSVGLGVVNMQARLNRLAAKYTAINTQTVDGKFGQNMYEAVMRFQRQFGLNPDGVIGQATWMRIVQVDAGCTASGYCPVNPPYPGSVLGIGASGDNVRIVQSYMSAVPNMPNVNIDGAFGPATQALVRAFQTRYNLKVDGMVGSATWATMVSVFNALH